MAIKDNFGNPSGTIGRLMLSGMNMGHTKMAKWGFGQFEIPQSGKIVDIGCGGGYNLKRLLAMSSHGMVYGVDISPVSVEKSRNINKKYIGTRCAVFQGSAEKLPFDDNSLELATAFETVYFWKNIEECFCEVRRVLKSGGRFAVINDPGDPEKHWEDMVANMTAYSPEDIAALMERAGFTGITVTKNRYTYCVVGAV